MPRQSAIRGAAEAWRECSGLFAEPCVDCPRIFGGCEGAVGGCGECAGVCCQVAGALPYCLREVAGIATDLIA